MQGVNVSTDAPVPRGEYVPHADRIVTMRVDWNGYEKLLELRSKTIPRMHYLDGVVQLMTTSRDHEHFSHFISRMFEAFAYDHGIVFAGYGKWTLKDQEQQAAAESDECYIVGRDQTTDRPSLAIEVEWTSGGIDKLEIYRRLGVREVWRWRYNEISVYVLGALGYELCARSELVPALDLELVCRLADECAVTNDAIVALRASYAKP